MIGKTLAHYEVTERLGAGGMGEVYRAKDARLGRDVAIKVLPEIFAADSERVARLEREARLLAALNHPNIGTIYGFERSGETHFLVLELVEGETLAEHLSRGPMAPAEALRISRQMVDALEAAHDKGVVHRDLKPANIKITPEGKVKVLDFGLAKAFAAEQASTQLSQSPTLSIAATNAGVILGTAAYMSPEQAKGSLNVDRRSDIFSFGCVLYEMLTARQTFTGDSVPEVLASVLARDPDLSRLPANLNPRLRELLQRCLDKDVKKRWQAVGDIRLELDAIASDPQGIEVQPALATKPSYWKAAALVFGGLILGLALAGTAAWNLRPAVPAAPPLPFSYILPEGRNFSRTRSQVAAISPDGMNLVYVADRQLYLKRMSDREAGPIRGTDLDVSSPFFSPDGQWIAFNSFQESALKKIPITGGAPITLCPVSTTLGFGMHWQGNTIVFAEGGREIVAVEDKGGTPEVLVKAGANDMVTTPQLLPGGDLLMFSRRKVGSPSDTADILVLSRKTGKETILIRGGSGARYVPTGHIVYALSGNLLAATFDIDRLETGSPVSIVENLARSAADYGAANFDFSMNGTLIYVPGGNSLMAEAQRMLTIVDRAGKLTAIPGLTPGSYFHPRVNPKDGTQVAVEMTDNGSITIIDLSGKSQPRPLTLQAINNTPIWSPDGKQIAFRSNREGKIGILVQNADGTGDAERLTTANVSPLEYPFSWSPDSQHITLLTGKDPDAGISTIALTGERKIEVFADEPASAQFNASFHPGGQWVAYESDEGQARTPQIYVRQFPKGATYRVTTRGYAHAPVWSHDGQELFYYRSDLNQLLGVRIQTKPTFSVGEPVVIPVDRVLQSGIFQRNYDVMPDGRFLVLQPSGTDTGPRPVQEIHVVLNWFEELKQRVPK